MAKRIMRAFKLDEISAVDRPAQAHAKMTIMKRARPALAEDIAKAAYAIAEAAAAPGAKSFADILAANEQQRAQWEANEELWPLFCALEEAIRSTASDTSMATADKLGSIRQSVEDFLNTVAEKVPAVEEEIGKSLIKHHAGTGNHVENTMTKEDIDALVAKSVADALAKAAKEPPKKPLPADMMDDQEPDGDEPTKKAWRAYVEKKVAKALSEAADIAKRDETFEAEGTTIRKSEVGEGTFKVLKAQQERIELGDFEKRAKAELPNLPGTDIAKAKALRALGGLGEETRKALEGMLVAGQEAMAKMTKGLGHNDGRTFSKAQDELDSLVDAHASEKGITKAAAYDAVLKTEAGRKLYAASEADKAPPAA